jgi:predicted dehydrogenase
LESNKLRRPRVGFLGIGWIGRHRLKSIAETGCVEIVGLADFDRSAATAAAEQTPGAVVMESLHDLLQFDLDGLVIATPTALHAEQCISALESRMAVFCQKPLGRTASETRLVVKAARGADRLLAIDMSYRLLRGVAKLKEFAAAGAVGEIYAIDLAFHNAYGPDKRWYYDPLLSGGGCVIDLGIHLVDLALWMLDFPEVQQVSSRLFAQGKPLRGREKTLEDYAVARLDMATGTTVNLSCSWHLPAGRDAVIRAFFYGTKGGLALRNVRGSFYDFCAEQFLGTSRKILDEPPDNWGGRAASAWAERLCEERRFDPEIEKAIHVAEVVDAIYGR